MGAVFLIAGGCILVFMVVAVINKKAVDDQHYRQIELQDIAECRRLDEYERRDEKRRLEAERREELRRLERADERAIEIGYKGMELELTRTRTELLSRDRELAQMRSRLDLLERKEIQTDPRDIGEMVFDDDIVVAGITEDSDLHIEQ